jgi:hypothetical protein
MSGNRLAALALATTTLAICGCGGSSGSSNASGSSGSSKTLTRAELITKANAICARVNTKRASTHYRTLPEVARSAPRLASYEQAAAAELGKLVPPAEMSNDWQQIVANARALAGYTLQIGEYAKAKNVAAAQPLLTSIRASNHQLVATARAVGLTECSRTS